MAFVIAPEYPGVSVIAHAADAAEVSRRVRRQPLSGRVIGHIVLIAIAIVSIFPIYWLFVTALRKPAEYFETSIVPTPISFENFVNVWNRIPMAEMLGNTFLMALLVAVGQLLIAILAAYGFAMWNFPGKSVLFLLFLGSWLIPFQITMLPNYLMVARLGLLDTVAGVVIPNLTSAFAVMMMRQHMQSFPRELLDAAHLDGRNHWTTLWTVVLPNMRPALAALGIMTFIEGWNNYVWPALILQHNPDALLQTGIRSFLGEAGDDWGGMMAAAGLACIPIFLIYVFLSRYIQDAFVRSGLR